MSYILNLRIRNITTWKVKIKKIIRINKYTQTKNIKSKKNYSKSSNKIKEHKPSNRGAFTQKK